MVSIIIATYNSGKTLRRALDSVLNQSCQDWECIVVDGASKDNTIGIVKEYVSKDARFRYISEPDHGIYDAFNKGWKMAKGEWLMYLGSDDEYTKDGIKVLMENSDGADVVYGNVILKYSDFKQKKQKASHVNFTGTQAFCCHQAVAMKKEVLLMLNGFDEKYKLLADWDILRRAGQRGFYYKFIDTEVAFFFVGGASSYNYDATFEAYRIYKKSTNTLIAFLTLSSRLCRKFLLICRSKYVGH